jgi:hypothetical protein
MESNDEGTLWSVGESPNKRRRVEYDNFYERLETQDIGPLSAPNCSDFLERNDFTGYEQSMSYYRNDETTFFECGGFYSNT